MITSITGFLSSLVRLGFGTGNAVELRAENGRLNVNKNINLPSGKTFMVDGLPISLDVDQPTLVSGNENFDGGDVNAKILYVFGGMLVENKVDGGDARSGASSSLDCGGA